MDELFDTAANACRQVVGTVEEVLPTLGLAYVLDEAHVRWAVTRSTAGSGFHRLDEGLKVALTVSRHGSFEIASACDFLA